MPNCPAHLAWLVNTNEVIATKDGLPAEVWRLEVTNDEAVLSAWAAHFRQHYCSDALIDALRHGTGKSRAEYLIDYKFPDSAAAPGPSIRAGDFAEILVADYVEHKLGYWCPRELRYEFKWNRNESTKGCDVIGFRFVAEGEPNPDDELFIFEAKAALSGNTAKNRLQDAIDDSTKDVLRESMSLNAMKQRYLERADGASATKVERFQDQADRPFRRINGAAAVFSDPVFDAELLGETATSDHPNQENLKLVIITGEALMQLVHALYERAANEA